MHMGSMQFITLIHMDTLIRRKTDVKERGGGKINYFSNTHVCNHRLLNIYSY